MNTKDAEEIAREYDSKLMASDPRFNKTVMIIFHDGSVFTFQNAFCCKIKDGKENWFCVFTEHHRFHVCHSEECDIIQFGKREYAMETIDVT